MTPQIALLGAAFGAMLLTALLGVVMVPLLQKLTNLYPTKNAGPAWHAHKRGTPTMGGIMLIFSAILAVIVFYSMVVAAVPEISQVSWQQSGKTTTVTLLFALANGALGLANDILKLRSKNGKGIPLFAMLLAQLVFTAFFMAALQSDGMLSTVVQLPGIGLVDLKFAFYPLSYFLILAVINGVNATDGVDGLAVSVTFLVLLALLSVASLLGWYHIALFSAAVTGACAGFLCWNFPPAKIFMGDTGSLFLGGAVAGIAFSIGHPELLLLLGLVYFVELLSMLVQIVYCKARKGKCLFKTTPLHHHLELCGWSEVKITGWFSGAALVCVAISLVFAYMYY